MDAHRGTGADGFAPLPRGQAAVFAEEVRGQRAIEEHRPPRGAPGPNQSANAYFMF